VFLQRSYPLLVKYTALSIALFLPVIVNSFYLLVGQEQVVPTIIVYTITYVLGLLITVYPLTQKKYFNKA